MFKKCQAVRVIILDDELADGQHSASMALLSKDTIYRVDEYHTPEECAKLWPDATYWQENGGRMTLKEKPDSPFFGKRFELVGNEDGLS